MGEEYTEEGFVVLLCSDGTISDGHATQNLRFSKTTLFSTWYQRSMHMVSEKVDRVVLIISSLPP